MRIALVQQRARPDRDANRRRGLQAVEEILVCELDLARMESSPARRLFLRDRRPELYGPWLA